MAMTERDAPTPGNMHELHNAPADPQAPGVVGRALELLLASVDAVLVELKPGQSIWPAGAGRTNALISARNEARRVLSTPPPGVVKPLAWRFFDVGHDYGRGVWDANGPWSTYSIYDCAGKVKEAGYRYYVPCLSNQCATLEAAQAACQADFNTRIASTLVSAPPAGKVGELVGKLWALSGIAQPAEDGFTHLNESARELIIETARALAAAEADRDRLAGKLSMNDAVMARLGGEVVAARERTEAANADRDRLAYERDVWREKSAMHQKARVGLTAVEADRDRLARELEWYGEQARLARLSHSEGDAGRNALAKDGGKRARTALKGEAP